VDGDDEFDVKQREQQRQTTDDDDRHLDASSSDCRF